MASAFAAIAKCYGSAHCSAMSLGQSAAQNGAAAEDSTSVMRRAEITSRAPARRTRSRKRRRLQPVLSNTQISPVETPPYSRMRQD